MSKTITTAKVVFLDKSTMLPDVVLRQLSFPHEWIEYEATRAEEVSDRIADAHVVITNKAPVTKSGIATARNLKLVAVAATGTDMVDIAACTARNVLVSNIRDYAVDTVPEHTFALLFALRRSLLAYRDSVRAGRWAESGQFCYFDYPIRNIAGSVLGVIGDGALGRAVAGLARAFGMRVLFSSYKGVQGMGPLYTPFEDVLRLSDAITIHAPLTPATRNMIGAPEFALMERKPILINTARGGLVDEIALGEAIRSGRISGAGFDVATVEPPSADHPLMQLIGLPNFILTPHVAWASQEAVQSLADQLIDNIEAFWNGTPKNVVRGAP
ncbi:D-2-hydroxyacid dehydrogenase [Bradyrhizobium sp. Gha]|uniref:D-2-hydroxyacid dehydrogenase n=1 Tax=Bradyrhizobium sp. Gha TaxID=1855318 RepID=UPI000B880199|nr:D-2-hydroxyacid dehydrogenase [Bradyrhizobium sp. Gha]